jgi:D-alanyl-D-alanine carboxypeptidase/D-alanyl-D-alanine-endopeptidase (penicillin-binding protein 4)
MAHRQRSQAPAAAALIATLGLALASACTGDAVGAAAPRDERVAKSAPLAPLQAAPMAPVTQSAPRLAPADEARARALSERFRERIAHWTAEAVRLSKGKVAAREIRVATCVRALGGADWVALAADEPHAPASNLKLATTAAALILLGSDAQWVTPFESAAPLAGGTLAGDLVVRAAGDPLFDPGGRGEIEARLAAVARELRAAGLTHVRGDLVLDEGNFEVPGPGPAWPDPSQYWAEYCALSGGFSANGGVLHAHVRAGAVGAAAGLAVHPSPHGLKSSYDVRTLAGTKVDVRVGATISTVTVKGTLGQGLGEYDAEFAHPDPVALFGVLVSDALRTSGIQLDGGVRRQRNVPKGVVLAELRSPLAGCLEGINAESRNGVADQVFLSLGHAVSGEGTRAGGARAVGAALERLGLPAASVHQVDGSGLSRDDRVTARALCALLERVLGAGPASARLFRDSLAVMGQKGTLEERLRGTAAEGHVFAKTGWIAGVSALSGYAEPAHGPARVFSILIEYPSEAGGLNASCFKKLQDELVLLLFGEGS